MNWEILAAIGQLAAALVGIPSIIYLALQIRAQTRERRETAANALSEQWVEITKALHENEEFAALVLRGMQSFDELDAVSKLRFSSFFNSYFNTFKGMYFSYRQGVLTEASWRDLERTMSDFLAYAGTRQWWETRKHWHTGQFGQLVDKIIGRNEMPKLYSTYKLSEIATPKNEGKLD